MKWIVGLLVCVIWTASRARASDRVPSLEAEVDAFVQPYVDGNNFSGSILIARQGKVLISKGYGNPTPASSIGFTAGRSRSSATRAANDSLEVELWEGFCGSEVDHEVRVSLHHVEIHATDSLAKLARSFRDSQPS